MEEFIIALLNRLGIGLCGVTNSTALQRNIGNIIGSEIPIKCTKDNGNIVEFEIQSKSNPFHIQYTLKGGCITGVQILN